MKDTYFLSIISNCFSTLFQIFINAEEDNHCFEKVPHGSYLKILWEILPILGCAQIGSNQFLDYLLNEV